MDYMAITGAEWVPPTQDDYDRECVELEVRIGAIKRHRDLARLDVDALVADYLLVDGQYRELARYMRSESRAIWGNGFDGAKKVQRRANRQRAVTHDYLRGIRDELLTRGAEGITGIKRLFSGGEPRIALDLATDAAAYFPDEAEPVLEGLLEWCMNDAEHRYLHRPYLQDLLTRLRGYRARGPAALVPAIDLGAHDGLAPTLAPNPGSPASYPGLLLDRLATNVFTGRMGYRFALLEAWKWVAEDRRLDPAEVERAECATFDFALMQAIEATVVGLQTAQGKAHRWRPDTPAVPADLAYVDACDRPVARETMIVAMSHAAEAPDWPYEAATSWRRVR